MPLNENLAKHRSLAVGAGGIRSGGGGKFGGLGACRHNQPHAHTCTHDSLRPEGGRSFSRRQQHL